MYRRILGLILVCACAGKSNLHAQDFKLFDRTVQIHGFVSQGFVHTDQNNWLTMYTSNVGSGEASQAAAVTWSDFTSHKIEPAK